jgi:hypothetical protein
LHNLKAARRKTGRRNQRSMNYRIQRIGQNARRAQPLQLRDELAVSHFVNYDLNSHPVAVGKL